jgi:hypothetical protein
MPYRHFRWESFGVAVMSPFSNGGIGAGIGRHPISPDSRSGSGTTATQSRYPTTIRKEAVYFK